MHIVLALTGASGAPYGLRLCRELLAMDHRVTLLISTAGFAVLQAEAGLNWQGTRQDIAGHLGDYFPTAGDRLHYCADDDLLAPIASGSAAADAMIVCPCSMGTLARIAAGISGNLLERCADVMLKEQRPLVLVPRETPLSAIHLENMLKLARLGVRLVPAMPAFYQHPESLADLVDFVVGKALEAVGIAHGLYRPWGTTEQQ
jgi:flavin prenyltransferase